MRATPAGDTVMVMQREAGTPSLRVVIVDDHAVTRAACRALLRTEGVEVLADVAADHEAVAAVQAARPDIVVIDVAPDNPRGVDIARRIRALPDAPDLVFTSSAGRERFGSELDGVPFVAKADLCSHALVTLAAASPTGQFESIRPGPPAPRSRVA